MAEEINLNNIIPESLNGLRLDQAAARLFHEYSRSMLKGWIETACLTVNDSRKRPKDKVFFGDRLRLRAELTDDMPAQAQPIPLDIVFEDAHIAIINKPAGLVVHPAAGNTRDTLLNGLLYRYPESINLPRAGIVHRLDKNTTGLMVVAKTLRAHTSLVKQLQQRTVKRQYAAVVTGVLTGGGEVNAPIGRHPSNRVKMAVVTTGKESITHYRIIQRFRVHTHISLSLETGRTHQIRVHMSHLRHPLIGDTLYGARRYLPGNADQSLIDILTHFPRQALHAQSLGLSHPVSHDDMEWSIALPDDFQQLIKALDNDSRDNKDSFTD